MDSDENDLDATGRQEANSQPALKPYWEITSEEVKKYLSATSFCPAVGSI